MDIFCNYWIQISVGDLALQCGNICSVYYLGWFDVLYNHQIVIN